ncbi:MAG: SpoIID/LytB domain-containing protein [Candidatus Gastranaerophilales bacterium]|nr:SpoIID/LytB domain-containing protein [Candidatus Gastranaerophilales bacterium]
MKKYIIILSIILFSICSMPTQAIKIGLSVKEPSVMISASDEAQIIDVKTNKQVCIIHKMLMYEVTPIGDKSMIVRSNYGQCTIYTNDVVLKPLDTNACVYTKGKWYRGILRIQNTDNTLTVINDICMENYIQGVLSSEMPSSWDMEALKAQAIAARTYAVANYGKHCQEGFDLVDTQMDQVYNGIEAETENSNKAVLETEGIIMIYNNKPITAMYSSSAGGQTHSALEAWGNNIPYLQSVPSYDDNVKSAGHGVGMTQHGAKNLAKMGNNAYQILSHFYNNIQFARLNPVYYK